jgi:hypothetical protein
MLKNQEFAMHRREASATGSWNAGATSVPSYVLSICASALGEREGAIGFCEEAVKDRDVIFGLFHQWSPNFEPVRTDARFADILARFTFRGRTRP